MECLKIKKGDRSHYQVTLKYDQPKESPPDQFGKIHYQYGVYSLDQQRDVIFDASETLHKHLANFKKGDTVEVWYEDIGNGKISCKVKPFSGSSTSTPPASSSTNLPTKDREASIRESMDIKAKDIHQQTAEKLAVDTLSEKDKERTWTEIKVILAERERYFLERIEGGLRAETEHEKMNPEDKPGNDD